MNTVNIDFSKKRIGTVAKQGEHNLTELVLTMPLEMNGADYFNAEFEKPDGEKCAIENLEQQNGAVNVKLPQDVTSACGTIGIQLAAYKVDGEEITEIAKTKVVYGKIEGSVEATKPAETEASFFERLQAWLNDARDKLTALWELRHGHGNKATLDEIYSAALETPEPEITIGGMADPYRDQLSFRGQYLRMINDGGVIQGAEEVTVSGRKYLRLKIFYDPAVETYDIIEIGQNARPRFIDIPIASAQDSTIVDGGVTLNGTEISLGLDSVEQEIIGIQEDVAANTAASHTHDNLNALNSVTAQALTDIASNTAARHTHTNKVNVDKIGEVNIYGAITYPTYDTRPINGVRMMEVAAGLNAYGNTIYAGVPCVLQTIQTNIDNIVVTTLSNKANYFMPEYFLEFTTGATAPSLTLPSSIKFMEALTVEANKHYQISIVNNIALWCAVDVEVAS